MSGVGISREKNLSGALELERKKEKKELNVKHSNEDKDEKGKGRGEAVVMGQGMKVCLSNLQKNDFTQTTPAAHLGQRTPLILFKYVFNYKASNY